MAVSNTEKEYAMYVVDLMQSIGPVYSKKMFGGYGIFLDGLMFGLIANSVLYLKADKATETDFTERGLEAFSYQKQGKIFKLGYFQAPEETLDNIGEMRDWANKAYSVAIRAANPKKKK
ncbi:TfoX/Sxy family protein [Candidatus Berkiella cookevillensis]|uniref:TfoX/Sxy family protein n=1 Tax=Candidatus Berkiella cookevillensis TaxID=437022 RepID=A0A0Q9YV44_9GAMM|nr:TfoX/Sxy family protein [Candidatus Berkiella cookevillensis]MCS5708492.1 TfoX/Sxy family protein [Candidatus Berkiella cookevillensis]